ncbi:hypothetical protein ZEAMMB73_Zm00001d032371 [Zea mays]|uniref:Uncharacterized protein n=1 Tax=Zea mays TaxID=4577 RepID=A0A1D6KQ95_MAIZE|nr:hypothetical protein ZEAMMB73_Zm00001d032371 [Zea mays]
MLEFSCYHRQPGNL